jgi:sulfur carrier protein
MNVTVNGQDTPIEAPCTVRQLLVSLDLAAAPCAVEVNEELVPRGRHEQQELQEHDRVEIVTLVGGG